MIDLTSAQDVPPRVMDLLRIFLAASSRGEEAVLTLKTSKKAISTKFRRALLEYQQSSPQQHPFGQEQQEEPS